MWRGAQHWPPRGAARCAAACARAASFAPPPSPAAAAAHASGAASPALHAPARLRAHAHARPSVQGAWSRLSGRAARRQRAASTAGTRLREQEDGARRRHALRQDWQWLVFFCATRWLAASVSPRFPRPCVPPRCCHRSGGPVATGAAHALALFPSSALPRQRPAR